MSTFGEGFYLNGPLQGNKWAIYLCCKESNTKDKHKCLCKKCLLMEVSLKKESSGVVVDVSVTNQPDVRFIITKKMGSTLREQFSKDKKKHYFNLVNVLYDCEWKEEDCLEAKCIIKGFVAYMTWTLLALAGQDVGQGSFTPYLTLLGSGAPNTQVDIEPVEIKVDDEGNKYIYADEDMSDALLTYNLMLNLDTTQQTLLSCNLIKGNWIKMCLYWNRCVRSFFHCVEEINTDLTNSLMHGIIISFSNYVAILALKEKDIQNRLAKLEYKSSPQYRETSVDFKDDCSTPHEKTPERHSSHMKPPIKPYRENFKMPEELAKEILAAEASWKSHSRCKDDEDSDLETYKPPKHLYQFGRRYEE